MFTLAQLQHDELRAYRRKYRKLRKEAVTIYGGIAYRPHWMFRFNIVVIAHLANGRVVITCDDTTAWLYKPYQLCAGDGRATIIAADCGALLYASDPCREHEGVKPIEKLRKGVTWIFQQAEWGRFPSP